MAIFRKQGVFWIDYYFQGKRKREKVGTSRSLAGKVLIKRQAEIAEGRYFPARRRQAVSFRAFSETYWERHWQHLKGNGGRYVRELLEKTFGEKNLTAITVAEVQDFY